MGREQSAHASRPHKARSVALGFAAMSLLACGAPPAAPLAAPPSEPAVFVNVTVIPMTGSDERLFGRTVVVENGRIQAVGRTGEVAIPAGAQLIPGGGRTLLPGLVDACAGPVEAHDAPVFVLHGVTSVRTGDASLAQAALTGRIEAGAVLGPRLFLSATIDGQAYAGLTGDRVEAAAAGRAAVSGAAANGFTDIALSAPLATTGYRAVHAAAGERAIPLALRSSGQVLVETSLALGVHVIEGMAGYGQAAARGRLPAQEMALAERSMVAVAPGPDVAQDAAAWSVADPAMLSRLAQYTAARGVWSCPALTAQIDPAARADGERVGFEDAVAFTPRARRALWREQTQTWPRDLDVAADARRAAVRALHAAGAPIVTGSGVNRAPYLVPGAALHDEMDHWIAAGLAPADVLRAATTEAARFLDQDGAFGVVARGARADLILVEGDPLADISVLRAPDGVMAAGRWLDAEDLRRIARRAQATAQR